MPKIATVSGPPLALCQAVATPQTDCFDTTNQKFIYGGNNKSDSTMCACTNNKNHSGLPPSCPAHLLVSPIILQVIAHYIPLAPNLVLRTMHCNAIEGSIKKKNYSTLRRHLHLIRAIF